jgi:ComEC/Rec2-related protein
MINWHKYPFIRLILPFALGIWIFVFFFNQFVIAFPKLLFSLAVLLLMAILVSRFIKSFSLNWCFGFIINLFLILLGFSMAEVRDVEMDKNHYLHLDGKQKFYVARVYEDAIERPNSVKLILDLEYAGADSGRCQPVNGKILGYFQKTDMAFSLHYGDLIVFTPNISEVAAPGNPGEFNYKAYLSRKGITGQVYLKESDWLSLNQNDANPIFVLSYRVRDYLLSAMQRCGVRGDEFGVAAAILLGYDESLPFNVRQGYVTAGAMHILCVSGMHVGVIFLIASFLLSFMDKKKWQKLAKQVILLSLIWFYALLAGLSPSILRASLMLTFCIVGELINRKGFVLNSIAASAFILLCINPFNLFEIGFLLSYMAVIGIVVLQKPIYDLFYVKNKLLNKVWEITAVALAAQIATAPFTIFYFNQFPSYFWLSNLIMTPVSFVVILSGMLLLAVSFIPYANVAVGYVVWGMVYAMNWVIETIESLPFALVKGLYMNEFEFAIVLALLVLLFLLVTLKKHGISIAMLGLCLLFLISIGYRRQESAMKCGFTVYNLRKHTAIDFIYQGDHVIVADSALSSDVGTVSYSIEGNWNKQGLSLSPEYVLRNDDFSCYFMRKKKNLISFDGKLIVLWDDSLSVEDSLENRVFVDYLMVSGKTRPDPQKFVNVFDMELLIIDGSVPKYLARKWKTKSDELGISYYDVAEKGAFVCDFDD